MKILETKWFKTIGKSLVILYSVLLVTAALPKQFQFISHLTKLQGVSLSVLSSLSIVPGIAVFEGAETNTLLKAYCPLINGISTSGERKLLYFPEKECLHTNFRFGFSPEYMAMNFLFNTLDFRIKRYSPQSESIIVAIANYYCKQHYLDNFQAIELGSIIVTTNYATGDDTINKSYSRGVRCRNIEGGQ